MKVNDAIEKRRSFRDLVPVEITDEIISALSRAAMLAPSCYNNQPWRYIFVNGEEKLNELFTALSPGNEWAKNASLIIAVYTSKDKDCIIKEREYAFFDTGLSAGFIMLMATELGLIAHAIAGYSHEKAKEILSIPSDSTLITLIVVGLHSVNSHEDKIERPERKPFDDICSVL